MTQVIGEAKCPNCGAPLMDEKCEYCAHVSKADFFSVDAKGKSHRYYISYGDEGFNVYSDLLFEAFVSQFVGKEWLRIGGSMIRVPMIKFVTDYEHYLDGRA